MIVFIYKWLQNAVFRRPQSAAHLHTAHTPWMTLRQGSGAETAYSFATEW